ncbi:hypothetical protein EZV62_019339 [Acer yangbiense]|uniref:Reverse transcriptase Ty1/copia-type domain-containing protein n=1 Tax=Acer yangbiense TaxID=1000413 RepID=A0A5C7HA36_9ROSI|nr:hypothetical protein EZV62_019339 [Acer yangbiense]
MQFLMGLNESYATTQGSILMISPLPDTRKVHALVLQQERQTDMVARRESMGYAAMQTSRNSPESGQSHEKDRSTATGKVKKTYFHYGKDYHTADRCYFLHGFPPGHKLYGKDVKPRGKKSTNSLATSNEEMPKTKQFTAKEYDQIMTLLRKETGTLNPLSIPQGFRRQGEPLICRLHKSLYGLKQASQSWFHKFLTAINKFGFQQSRADYSLFTKVCGDSFTAILLYVDDMIITRNDPKAINDVKTFLGSCFKLKDLGVLKYFLRVEIARSQLSISINQRKYTLDILQEAGLLGSKPAKFPMEQSLKLTSTDALIADRGKELEIAVGEWKSLITHGYACFIAESCSLESKKEEKESQRVNGGEAEASAASVYEPLLPAEEPSRPPPLTLPQGFLPPPCLDDFPVTGGPEAADLANCRVHGRHWHHRVKTRALFS